MSGKEDKIKGDIKQPEGTANEASGKVPDIKSQEIKGKVQHVAGSARKKLGEIKESN